MTNLSQLTFTKTKQQWKLKNNLIKVILYEITNPPDNIRGDMRILGVDPGKNFGISVLGKDIFMTAYGKLDDSSLPLRDSAFYLMEELVDIYDPDSVIVEGASYGDRFGQVKLAEVRCGFSLGASNSGKSVEILAPKTPRKTVFGNGDIVAMNVFPTINHNAADALCLGLYPFYRR